MTPVLHRLNDTRVVFHCPGCNSNHQLTIASEGGPVWGWNGDMVKPTFTPSVLVTTSFPSDDPEKFDDPAHDVKHVCHSFVNDGRIQYLADCTHSLAGQTVDIRPWE